MKAHSFAAIAALVHQRAGVSLPIDKDYLVEARLTPIVCKYGLRSLDALAAMLAQDKSGRLAREVVEAMTTNESSFFRDIAPFDQLREVVLPRLARLRANTRLIRIWCAACSNGQEPYSIAMLVKEAGAALANWHIS